MFTGTTTVALALLPGVTKVVTLDLEPYLKDINMPHFMKAGVAGKIDIRIGDALESLSQLIRESARFDMVTTIVVERNGLTNGWIGVHRR